MSNRANKVKGQDCFVDMVKHCLVTGLFSRNRKISDVSVPCILVVDRCPSWHGMQPSELHHKKLPLYVECHFSDLENLRQRSD